MKKIVALVAIGLLAVFTSCHTKNVGNGGPQFLAATITIPAAMNGGADATWIANIQGGQGPYTVSWDFGGGATPNTATFANQAGPTSSTTETMVNPSTTASATYNVKVTVTDALNTSFTTPGAGVSYTVGPTLNQTPVVNSATFAAATNTLTVSVSDPDDAETLTVTVTPPAGFTVDNTTKTAAATGPLTATFSVSANDLFAGATGNFGVTVTDSKQATGTFAGGVDVTIPPISLTADNLYAIPLSGSVATDTPVTIVVATGVPANPFQYMTGVGLTMPSDGTYVKTTFNCGVPGGAIDDIDGFWAIMNPGGGFLLAPDNFITPTDIGGGTNRWDFNITPLSGSNQTAASGALFNAQFKFSAAGAKPLAFQDVSGVKRTYYSSDTTEFFWGDITNVHAGVPSSITVN